MILHYFVIFLAEYECCCFRTIEKLESFQGLCIVCSDMSVQILGLKEFHIIMNIRESFYISVHKM